jgi:hypothetical protein
LSNTLTDKTLEMFLTLCQENVANDRFFCHNCCERKNKAGHTRQNVAFVTETHLIAKNDLVILRFESILAEKVHD